jgi:hypothetical protein
MAEDAELATPRFEPLRPAPRSRRIAVFVIGPVLWLTAVVVVAALLKRTFAIELGLLIAFGSFLFAAIVLLLLRAGRQREEKRYAASG